MKKLLGILTVAVMVGCVATGAFAADQTKTTDINATVGGVFSLAFYNDAKVLFNTSITFTTVDPSNAYNYPDGRAEGDGKSDIGLLATSNQGVKWYLKINLNSGSSLAGKLGAYMSQPVNRNWGTDADGARTNGDVWWNLPTTATTIYTAGAVGDYTNTPFGTLATLSYKIDGTGMAPGSATGTVTYTLTQTP